MKKSRLWFYNNKRDGKRKSTYKKWQIKNDVVSKSNCTQGNLYPDHHIHSSVFLSSQAMDQFKGQPRLPKFALSKQYDIHLKPDLSSCYFTGFVSNDLDIGETTRFIVLNAADLSINDRSVSFTTKSSSKVFYIFNNFLLSYQKLKSFR